MKARRGFTRKNGTCQFSQHRLHTFFEFSTTRRVLLYGLYSYSLRYRSLFYQSNQPTFPTQPEFSLSATRCCFLFVNELSFRLQ